MKIAIQAIVFNAEKNLPPKMVLAWLEQADAIGDAVFITEGATRAESHHLDADINHLDSEAYYFDGQAYYPDGDTLSMTQDGKSTDNTCAIIKEFIKDKPKFHFKEAEGFWNGKTRMLNHWFYEGSPIYNYDYVWQIDLDEFYNEESVRKIKNLINNYHPERMDFFANHFWGDFNHCMDERADGIWAQEIPWRRIFRLHSSSLWISHEPPRMNIYEDNFIDKYQTLNLGIKLDHYSYVTRDQVDFKSKFFNRPEKLELFDKWQKDKTIKVFGCQSLPFTGEHCGIIKKYYNL